MKSEQVPVTMQTATGSGESHKYSWYEAIIERDMNKSVIKASKVGGGGGSSASIMQKVCDLGGLFVLLYIIFLGLTTLITMG